MITNTSLAFNNESAPHPIDLHVGGQLRRARLLAGLNQGQVATAAGVSFQQLQKYERGVNRITASRLYEIATVLSVPVSYFFDAIPGVVQTVETNSLDTLPAGLDNGVTASRREIIELVRAYMAIEARTIRNGVRTLLEELAKQNKRDAKNAKNAKDANLEKLEKLEKMAA